MAKVDDSFPWLTAGGNGLLLFSCWARGLEVDLSLITFVSSELVLGASSILMTV